MFDAPTVYAGQRTMTALAKVSTSPITTIQHSTANAAGASRVRRGPGVVLAV